MTHLAKWHLRRWAFGLLALLAWIALSLAWSWSLVNQTFERDIHSRIISRTQQLALLAHEHLQPSPSSATTFPTVDNHPELQADVETTRRLDPNIAYAMIWTEDGRVIAHTRPELRLTRLASTLWPELDPQKTSRISRLTVPDLSKDPKVIEATVPVKHLGKTIAFVSIAYPQQWFDDEFWRTQGRVLLLAGGFTLAGLVILFLAIHFTIARLDRRRREIRQTAQARTSLLTERGMLASVLAHEVRSPLTALRFNLHSLRTLMSNRSTDIDRQVELTDRCEREIRRLDGMLNDFLQRTQVIGPAGLESASVNTVVSEAIEFLRPALERNHIHIAIHLDPSNPLVHVHPDELRQVILNLAANAQEAMPKGKGGTLALSTVAEDPIPVENPTVPINSHTPPATATEGTVTILIRDSGTGIPPDLHERIFEPFFSTKPNGSGLGLALVRRVVSGAGGTVSCESVINEGTTFRIVLPRAQPDAQRPIQSGHGYAHIRRDEPALHLDESPEIVIDKQDLHAAADSPSIPQQDDAKT